MFYKIVTKTDKFLPNNIVDKIDLYPISIMIIKPTCKYCLQILEISKLNSIKLKQILNNLNKCCTFDKFVCFKQFTVAYFYRYSVPYFLNEYGIIHIILKAGFILYLCFPEYFGGLELK